MLHYLFTNDLRHEAWPDILVDTAALIHEDKVPSAVQNKSKNNYICTQASYLCIQKGTRANEYCRNGKVGPVVLNFINRFQFPNARTKESYEQSVSDGMSIAPLRVAVQLLFALRLVDKTQSRLSYDEVVKYIVCNQKLAIGSETNLLTLANQIVKDRVHGITPPHLDSNGLVGMGVEWKHCPRQVKELFSLLEFAPFIKSTAVDVQLEIPESIDAGAAKQFFYIVNNRELWHVPQATDWSVVQRSYQEYMETGLAQFEVDSKPPSKNPALPEPNVDRLTLALKQFQEARKTTGSTDVRHWIFSPGEQACRWDEMRDGGVMALSYEECERDLREYANEEAIRAEFKSSEEDGASYKNHVRALTDFLNVMKPGDLVFAKKGTKTFLGVGRVTGEYEFAADAPDYKHRRAVEWLKVETVEREDAVARKTLTDVTRYGDLVRELCEAYGISDSDSNEGTAWSAYWELNPRARQYFDELRKNIDKLDKDKVVEMFIGVKKNDKVVFNPMWSGSYGTGWNSLKRGLEEENSKTIEIIRRYCASAADLAVFATKEDAKNRPLGFGNSVVSELLMKFHPDVAMKCGSKTIAVYHDLQLMEFKRENDYSAIEYTKALGIAADIRQRMDRLGITRMVEDNEPADYLTVNEFIAWCGDNKDLIKEKVMEKQLKPITEKLTKYGEKSIKDALKDDEMLQRLAAALRTKPFAILAGHSGTGKSSLVRRLAYMTCADEDLLKEADENTLPGNYCMVQVKPNWHDSTDLLGYYSDLDGRHYQTTPFVEFICKAYAYPHVPFFVCLDEMNLAPVEQYFAEYLSAIESAEFRDGVYTTDPVVFVDRDTDKKANLDIVRQIMGKSASTNAAEWLAKHDLTLPGNLFIVGTVNMDETTCQFSRKVLDRAMTILMNKVEFETMAEESDGKKDEVLNKDAVDFFLGHKLKCGKLDQATQIAKLNALKEPLENTAFAIAYRFANEYGLYQEAIEQLLADDQKGDVSAVALDHLVLMKLLPRIHGEKGLVKGYFEGRMVDKKSIPGLKSVIKADGLSVSMMDDILKRSGDYLTFWP